MTKSPRSDRPTQFDAPFWFALLAGVFAVGAVTSFSLAAAAQDASPKMTNVVVADDT